MEYWTIKETFKDITPTEIQFLNKALKKGLEVFGDTQLPKKTIKGEQYPSNQWPEWILEHACGLLTAFRKVDGKWTEREEIIEKYIEYPIRKWGQVPFYDGEWDDLYNSVSAVRPTTS